MTEEQKAKQRTYRAEWARNRRKSLSPQDAEAERAKDREYRKARAANPEIAKRIRERGKVNAKRWRDSLSTERAEEMKAQKRAHMVLYYSENRGTRREYRSRPEVKAAHVKYMSKYAKENPQKVLALCHKRRARLLGNGGSYTVEEWNDLVEQCGHKCICCGRTDVEIKLTVDHIVPICKGGSNSISNIQPLCEKCNCKKHDKIINYLCYSPLKAA
jgi:5-methylcytosine-specific restriction endonuclease McrA